VIRFSAFLVVVAVGLLVAGVVTSKLLLVYLAIGVSGVALLALGVGAAVKWRELSGKPQAVASEADVQEPVSAQTPQAPVPQVQPEHQPAAAGAVALGGSAVPPMGMFPAVRSAGPGDTRRRPAAFTARPGPGAPTSAATRTAGQDQPGATDQAAEGTAKAAPDTAQPTAAPPPPPPPPASPEADAAGPEADAASPEADAAPPAAAPPAAAQAAAPTPASPEADAASPEADAAPAAADAAPEGPDPQTARASQTVVTVVPGVPRYHNASCILIRFMGEGDLETMTLAAAREAACTPCRACLPDQPDKQPDLLPYLLRRAGARTLGRDRDRHALSHPGLGPRRLAGSRRPGPRERPARRARSAPRLGRGRPPTSAARSGR
jgi:hypothetical protein